MPNFCVLFQSVGAGAGDLGILRRQHAGDADGADDLAVRHDRQAAFERDDVLQRQERSPAPPLEMASSSTLDGRLNINAVFALPWEISIEDSCTSL